MLIEAFLRGLVVIRRDGENTIDADALQLAGEFDHLARVVAAGAAKHGRFPLRLIDHNLDHAQVFGARERGAFAGGTARNQKVYPSVDLPADELAQSALVERQVTLERRNQRRAASCKHVPPPQAKTSAEKQRNMNSITNKRFAVSPCHMRG